MHDIKSYLEKFSSVLSRLSIIDRSFLDMEVLKKKLSTTSLIGVHITGPYQYLLINVDTSYDSLLQAFPTLYKELNNIKGTDMLNTRRQIFNFVENNIFKKSLPKECILHSINSCMCEYKKEVVNILNVLFPMLAEGFSIQRGSLFGFGLNANESTGTLLKLSTASGAVK